MRLSLEAATVAAATRAYAQRCQVIFFFGAARRGVNAVVYCRDGKAEEPNALKEVSPSEEVFSND